MFALVNTQTQTQTQIYFASGDTQNTIKYKFKYSPLQDPKKGRKRPSKVWGPFNIYIRALLFKKNNNIYIYIKQIAIKMLARWINRITIDHRLF